MYTKSPPRIYRFTHTHINTYTAILCLSLYVQWYVVIVLTVGEVWRSRGLPVFWYELERWAAGGKHALRCRGGRLAHPGKHLGGDYSYPRAPTATGSGCEARLDLHGVMECVCLYTQMAGNFLQVTHKSWAVVVGGVWRQFFPAIANDDRRASSIPADLTPPSNCLSRHCQNVVCFSLLTHQRGQSQLDIKWAS